MPRRLLFPLTTLLFLALIARAQSGAVQSAFDLQGKSLDPLPKAGKPTGLVFLRTDCPISNRYAPTIQNLSLRYSGQVQFWLVYPDKSESSAKIETYLDDYGYKLAALRDPQHALVKRARAEVTPEAAVFDSNGRLMYHGRIDNWYQDFGRSRGAPTTHELDAAIKSTLSGKAPATAAADAIGCYISDLQ